MDIEQASKFLIAMSPIIQALAWPLLVLYLVIHFNEDIKEFLKNITYITFKIGPPGVEVCAKKSIESAVLTGAATIIKSPSESIFGEKEVSRIANTIIETATTKGITEVSILWVDDSPENNNFERRALEALGMKFKISTNTEDAINKIESNNYDLIITDMKRLNDDLAGYTLLEKKIKLGDNTPLIIYTGYSTPKQIEEAKFKGAFGCTYDPQELFQLVLKIVKNKN
ncbi:MAG: response regulator [Methanothrix sp.]|nr:MAG: response regulator [Methanothrix sp.]